MKDTLTVDKAFTSLSDWLHRRAMKPWRVRELAVDLPAQLDEIGIPLMRMHIGIPILHPLFMVGAYTWFGDGRVDVDNYRRGQPSGEMWRVSPTRPVYEAGETTGRFRMLDGEGIEEHPLLRRSLENGGTDHLVQLTGFEDRTMPLEEQEGIIISYTSCARDGFSDDDLELLCRFRLPLSVVLRYLTQNRLVDDILNAYLGPYSGRRVYAGQVQRGDGDLIDAVILFSDLRRSSKLAEKYDLHGFLKILNQYFEITAGTVLEHGGEVLRYIGDASLAIFPYENFDSEEHACRVALATALDAVDRGRALNNKRATKGEPPIGFGTGLHVGTVMYGNIGTPTRIEFTVIGQAANEAARIESQCRDSLYNATGSVGASVRGLVGNCQ